MSTPIEKSILIVDDDETIRKTFALILGKTYRIYSAAEREEALARVRKSRVDLVIVDYRLPGGNGMELLAELRKAGYGGEAILISAHPDEIRIEDIHRYAIGQFFAKPLDLGVLNRSIEWLLQDREIMPRPT